MNADGAPAGSRRRRAFTVQAAALLLIAALAAPARADFAAPAVVVAERAPNTPSAGGAPDGRVALAWTRFDAAGRPVDIRLVVRGPGAAGRFGPAETLAVDQANQTVVAMGANGHLAVIWTGNAGGLFVRRRAPDGTLGAIEPITEAPYIPYKPAIGVDDAGNTIVAWTGEDGTVALRWARAGQPFGPAQLVAGGVEVAPSIAITGTGRALVGFSAAAGLPHPAVVVVSPLDGAPGPRRQLAAGAPAGIESAPQFAVARGRVLAAWTRGLGGAYPGAQLMTAVLDGEGAARGQRRIYAGYFLSTAVDLTPGRALVGWIDPTSGLVAGAVGDDAASFSAAFALRTTERRGTPIAAAVDSDGNAVLMWTTQTGGGSLTEPEINEVRTATILAGRSAPCDVQNFGSGQFGSPAIVMDEAGGGLAVWSEHAAGSIVAARWNATPTTCPGAGAAPAAGGPVSLTASRTTVRVARRPVVRVKLRCTAAAGCRGPATLKDGSLTLATGRLKLAAGRRGTLVLKPGSDRARRRLQRSGSLSATLALKLARAGAPSRLATLAVRLRVRR